MRGWTDVWLKNDFRGWDLTEDLAYIRVPVLIIQGEDDQYGTMRQIEIAQEECYCPVEVLLSCRAPSTCRTARRRSRRSTPSSTSRARGCCEAAEPAA